MSDTDVLMLAALGIGGYYLVTQSKTATPAAIATVATVPTGAGTSVQVPATPSQLTAAGTFSPVPPSGSYMPGPFNSGAGSVANPVGGDAIVNSAGNVVAEYTATLGWYIEQPPLISYSAYIAPLPPSTSGGGPIVGGPVSPAACAALGGTVSQTGVCMAPGLSGLSGWAV